MWDKVKNAIWADDGSKPAQPPQAQNQGQPQYQPQPGGNQVAQNYQPVQVNNKFVESLRQSLKARSSAFTALLVAADKLTNVIPDPNTRLKAAYEMVKGEGRGVREVSAAIDVHAQDLESQRMQFDQALDREKSQTLGTLQAELSRLEPANKGAHDQIVSMQAQIQKLTELINANSLRQSEIQTQIATENGRINDSKQQFETALGVVKSELEGQKNIILTALS